MRMDEAFYNLFMYLYNNKNVLEYAEIARSGPKSMIRNSEGSSNIYNDFTKVYYIFDFLRFYSNFRQRMTLFQ